MSGEQKIRTTIIEGFHCEEKPVFDEIPYDAPTRPSDESIPDEEDNYFSENSQETMRTEEWGFLGGSFLRHSAHEDAFYIEDPILKAFWKFPPTMKCICGFQEDDGNTVYCYLCDTWQHTRCYYIDKHGTTLTKEELEVIDHFCVDCHPRSLPVPTNLFHDWKIRRDLYSWCHDVELLREATNGLTPQDVFNRCEQPLKSMPLPDLKKEYREEERAMSDSQQPRWTYMTIDSFRPKDSIIGELRGKIGHRRHYIQDPNNQWEYLRHPAPFVFFHPKLPIYIDTRREGTICRYLRRSCKPNLSMRTFLENGPDCHFYFVATEDLDAGTELTIGWTLDEHIRSVFYHRNQDEARMEGDVQDVDDYTADWAKIVLREFGGCACGSPTECGFAEYDRRIANRSTRETEHSGKRSRQSSTGSDSDNRSSASLPDRRRRGAQNRERMRTRSMGKAL